MGWGECRECLEGSNIYPYSSSENSVGTFSTLRDIPPIPPTPFKFIFHLHFLHTSNSQIHLF